MRVADVDPGPGLQQIQRLVDEELPEPKQEPDEEGLIEPQRGAHLGPNFRGNGERQVAQRIVGASVSSEKITKLMISNTGTANSSRRAV